MNLRPHVLALALTFGFVAINISSATSLPPYVVEIAGTVTTQPDGAVPTYSTAAFTTKSILKKYASASHPLANIQLVLTKGMVIVVDKTNGAVGGLVLDLGGSLNYLSKALDVRHTKFLAQGLIPTPVGLDPRDDQLTGTIAGSMVFTEINNISANSMDSLKVKFTVGAQKTTPPAYMRIYSGKLTLAGKYTGATIK